MFQSSSRPVFGMGNGLDPVTAARPNPSSTTWAVTAFFLNAAHTHSGKSKSRWLV
ncbi:hypothetical protein D9M71_726050 [compost metagenome]